ncbi:DUF6843 domain-containing protein [Flavobacterium selenitireducens]|uniref:DUF6843 domain-containing protein n=1 Tax=Flavobacterium selenitireducens TaxID=2722704 RepID=UPI00168A7A6F|nr:hypothetical protein [Flavobacterium selenitireducens]MBD3581576.1 hypothetical protein [Flavobacterium selenitireducens]
MSALASLKKSLISLPLFQSRENSLRKAATAFSGLTLAETLKKNRPQMKRYDLSFYIGFTLIVLSWIISVMSFYLLVFTWIPYLVGTVLVALSNQELKKKLLTTTLPIVGYVPITFIFLYLYNYTSPKVFLISKEQTGILRIIYDQQCGEKYVIENDKITISFPKDGIIILAEKFDGNTNPKDEYYFCDDKGNRQKTNSIEIRSAGVIDLKNTLSNNSKDFRYVEYVINSNYQNDYIYRQRYDSLTRNKVNDCNIRASANRR